MKRRTFLKKSLILCSAIWAGHDLIASTRVLAASPATLTQVRWASHPAPDNPLYTRLVLELSAKAEAQITQDAQMITVVLKNCRAGKWKKALTLDGKIVTKAEISEDKKGSTTMLLRLASGNGTTQARSFYLPGAQSGKNSRLTIDVGGNFRPAFKSIPVEDTDLKFGPLDIRTDTNLVVVHHCGMQDKDMTAEEIHKLHLSNGWSGIGYHYVVRKDGSIERGRPMDAVGAHVSGYNTKSVGVVVVGNFDEVQPEAVQLEAASKVIAEICNTYNIAPSASSIVGHCDLMRTDCPGYHLYDKLPLLRGKIQSCYKAIKAV